MTECECQQIELVNPILICKLDQLAKIPTSSNKWIGLYSIKFNIVNLFTRVKIFFEYLLSFNNLKCIKILSEVYCKRVI